MDCLNTSNSTQCEALCNQKNYRMQSLFFIQYNTKKVKGEKLGKRFDLGRLQTKRNALALVLLQIQGSFKGNVAQKRLSVLLTLVVLSLVLLPLLLT